MVVRITDCSDGHRILLAILPPVCLSKLDLPTQVCENTNGGFVCDCKEGFAKLNGSHCSGGWCRTLSITNSLTHSLTHAHTHARTHACTL